MKCRVLRISYRKFYTKKFMFFLKRNKKEEPELNKIVKAAYEEISGPDNKEESPTVARPAT